MVSVMEGQSEVHEGSAELNSLYQEQALAMQ
jgi:hypothetical protein